MFYMKTRDILIAVLVFSASIRDSSTCFAHNRTESYVIPVGTPYFKECKCDVDTKNPDLKWLDPNDKEIPTGTGDRLRIEPGESSVALFIDEFSQPLEGNYKCVSKDNDGRLVYYTYRLYASASIYFYDTNDTQYIVKGKDQLITCQARTDYPIISWYKGKDEIRNNEKYNIQPNGLLVRNVSDDDKGTYNCSVSDVISGKSADKYIEIEIITVPQITSFIAYPDTTVLEGDKLVLNCEATGYPEPEYIFRKWSGNDNVQWTQQFNNITIEKATQKHRGKYYCVARNDAGTVKLDIRIEVLAAPIITNFDKNITATEGTEVIIKCNAVGRPRPEIIMLKMDGEDLDDDPDLSFSVLNISDVEEEITLNIRKAHRRFNGLYVCNASNEVNYTEQGIYLTVNYKPTFEDPEETVWVWNGKDTVLNCDYDSEPASEVEWRYNGVAIANDTMRQKEKVDYLIKLLLAHKNRKFDISEVVLYGTYECTATNFLGSNKKIFHVKEGFLPPQFDIRKVNITDLRATAVTFSIKEHYKDGPKLIAYTAEYDTLDQYEKSSIHQNRTWALGIKYIISNLKPNNTYLIRFAAVNEMGYGMYSESITFATPDKSIPERPEFESNTDYIEVSPFNKVLKLKLPEDNGAPIDSLNVKYCPLSESEEECIEETIEPTMELKLDHLKDNTTYLVELVAHNVIGNSTPTVLKVLMLESVIVELEPRRLTGLATGVILVISVIVVILCIVLLDLALFFTVKKGMIATCCNKKNAKRKEDAKKSRDKKGLLKDNGESDTLKTDNAHKEFEYNKNTGVITGKHSAV